MVHLFNLCLGHLDLVECCGINPPIDVFFTLVRTHSQHALQCPLYRHGVASCQQVGQIFNGDAQLLDVWDFTVDTDITGLGCRTDRRQRRHVPDHGKGTVFGVQWERHFPVHRHFVDRTFTSRFHPLVRNAIDLRLGDNSRIIGI